MFAVIKTGGKQYKVAADDVIKVELLDGEAGAAVAFDEVLMIGGPEGVVLGSPVIAGASVAGEVVDQIRTRKVIAFKKRRRKNSRRSRGHRQHLTVVRITDILADGQPISPRAEPAPIPDESAGGAPGPIDDAYHA